MNVRRPRPDELADVLALMRANDLADAGVSDWVENDLRKHWAGLDLDADAWVVELDGALAGYADLDDRGGGRVVADTYVHPERRGRGVRSELLRLVEERAREVMPAAGRAYVQVGTLGDSEALFRGRGYERTRSVLRLVVDLSDEPRADVPDGIELRPLRHPAEDRAAQRALEEGADHPPRPFEEFAERTFARDDFDPSLCPVALDGEELVGASLNWWKDEGDWGWIGSLGVRPAWRRRGIAEALMRWSFAEFFRRGERRVALGVWSGNEPAVALYERLGMRRFWEAAVWEKELRAG